MEVLHPAPRRHTGRFMFFWLTTVGLCQSLAMAQPPAESASLDLVDLIEHMAELRGRTVSVTGLFAGWEGVCAGPPPRHRSDWMLVDAPHCIYVSGPVPDGISAPPDIRSNGQEVTLQVQVELTKDGRAYLKR